MRLRCRSWPERALAVSAEKLVAVLALVATALVVVTRGSRVERLGFLALSADFLAAPLLQSRASWLAARR